MSSSGESFVLYVDHQDHPAPLSLCYHATGARRLSSTVDRYPPSTLTEVDNAYCPQCLNYHDAVSASRMGYCNKAACQKCPLCQAICGVAVAEKLLFFRCGNSGNCFWDSRSCGLQEIVSPEKEEDGTATTTLNRVEMARALEDLGLQLRNRRQAEDDALASQWKQLETAWQKRTQVEKPSSTVALESSSSSSRTTTTNSKRSSRNTIRKSSLDDEWSVEALETSLEEKRKNFLATEQSMESIVGLAVHRPSLKGGDTPSTKVHDDVVTSRISTKSMQLQIINSASLPVYDDDDDDDDPNNNNNNNKLLADLLLPLPIPLRVRTSRRCRAELKEGRPGILLKPKLNPLEGDTSMRSQHGQWWKKDSSAIHVMPRVRCVQQYERNSGNANCRVLLLKVTNPTLSLVRLRFAASSYAGEVDWENSNTTTTAEINNQERTTMLHQLLVDERQQKHVNVKVDTQILKSLATTESVDLLSAEDSFIELGGKSRDIPKVVQDWKPLQEECSNSGSAPPSSSSAIRLVACSSSTAWFELTICKLQQQQPQADAVEQAKTTTKSSSSAAVAVAVPAVPLALQIQLGAGFWDSSLIQPMVSTAEDATETEDWVSFDLVIVLA